MTRIPASAGSFQPAHRRLATHRRTTVELLQQLFNEATAIIAREYASDLTIAAVAQRLFTSRRQLQRAFREIGDTSFSELLTAKRMAMAAELLDSRRYLSVRQIAAEVGYKQPAQLARAFRRRYAAAPSEYRERERVGVASHGGSVPPRHRISRGGLPESRQRLGH